MGWGGWGGERNRGWGGIEKREWGWKARYGRGDFYPVRPES